MAPFMAQQIERFAEGIPHPEGVAFDSQGRLYTGSALLDHNGTGPIYRISGDGKCVEQFADTGGRVLGLAFDRADNLYVCDSKQGALFRIGPDGEVHLFADRAGERKLQTPNFLVFDEQGQIYVSDSGTATAGERTAALFRFTPAGEGQLFLDDLIFANGLALAPDGRALYVVETRDNRVLRVPITDGSAAREPEVFVDGLANGPDGLAFDRAGNLYITVTRPSQIVRVSPTGDSTLLVSDPANERMHAPSNIAFGGAAGQHLYIANLFGNHIGRLWVEHPGLPLFSQRGA